MTSSVLVTGATGFLGPYVCRALKQTGFNVRGAVRGNVTHTPDLDEVSVITGLDDTRGLEAAVAGATTIVHLAARVHVMHDSLADPLTAFRYINVEGTKTLLDAAATANVKRFVFISSVKAVGE